MRGQTLVGNNTIESLGISTYLHVMKKKETYEVYHETMRSAIDTAYDYARSKGYEPQDLAFWDSVPYGATRDFHIELKKDNKEQKKCLQMQLYRMETGRYELNAYIN